MKCTLTAFIFLGLLALVYGGYLYGGHGGYGGYGGHGLGGYGHGIGYGHSIGYAIKPIKTISYKVIPVKIKSVHYGGHGGYGGYGLGKGYGISLGHGYGGYGGYGHGHGWW